MSVPRPGFPVGALGTAVGTTMLKTASSFPAWDTRKGLLGGGEADVGSIAWADIGNGNVGPFPPTTPTIPKGLDHVDTGSRPPYL
jgi:hypothetical protein